MISKRSAFHWAVNIAILCIIFGRAWADVGTIPEMTTPEPYEWYWPFQIVGIIGLIMANGYVSGRTDGEAKNTP